MGWLSFTNITCLLFFIYFGMTFKSFYDMFYPNECNISDNKSKKFCINPVKNWHEKFTVNINLLHILTYHSII